jgi:hypothetical protein
MGGRPSSSSVGLVSLCACSHFASTGVATPNKFYNSGTSELLTKEKPTGIALTFLLFLSIFLYTPMWVATTWIWTTEVFSMNVRAQAVGMY